MKRKGKIIGIWILAAIMWFTFCPSNLYAEETEKIAIEKMEEFSSCEYPVGTSKEDIVAGLPETITGYDAAGKEYELEVTWEIPEDFYTDVPGEYVFRPVLSEDGYLYAAEGMPELHITILEEQAEERENELSNAPEGQGVEERTVNMGGELAPAELKINLLDQPWSVTKSELSFSWENSLVGNMGKQSAYRIVISQREDQLNKGEYVFDSGWKDGSENTSVLMDLSGVLKDDELYYWQVQIKNLDGVEGPLSLPQAFSTETSWTSRQGIWGSEGKRIVFLRRELDIPTNAEKVVLSATALDGTRSRQYVYNLYVNGTEIGLGPTRPNGKQLDYDTYDITDYVESGKNTIGVIAYSENNSAFLCQMTAYLSDGSKQVITNTGYDRANWRALDGDDIFIGSSNSSIGTSYYTAVQDNINASLYPAGWNKTGFHASNWKTPTLNSRFEGYTLQPSQNDIYKHCEVTPKSVQRKSDGSYLVDFGKEIIGTIRLNINGRSANVTFQYGEELDQNGNAKYKMATGNTYQETWKLKNGQQNLSGIGMKAFRYVTIRNMPVSLTKDQITGLTVRSAFDEEASDFESSNSVLNDIYDMTKYTSKMTTQGLYVDTQSRERLAYEGDALITGMTSFSYSPTSTAFKYSAEYLLNNTTWPSEYSLYNIMAIYQHYLYTGDKRMLEESYQALKSKTMEQFFDQSQGLMKRATTSFQHIMVDWPATDIDGYKTTDAYYNTVFNAVCVGGYEDMASIAAALGKESDQTYYQNLADTIRTNMIQKLYNSQTGEFYDGLKQDGSVVRHSAQHATAYALAFDIYNSQGMSDKMASAIEAGGELKMSVYGSYFLLQGLYNSNHGTLARKIMSNPDDEMGVRSWAYMMYSLESTITAEAWNYANKPNMSLSHAWGSAPGSMLVRGMFGIQPTSPGFGTFDMKIQPGGVQTASVKVPTMKGEIEGSYTIGGSGNITCHIKVPANATANLYVPVGTGSGAVSVNGNAVTTLQDKAGYTGCMLEGGEYTVEIQAGIAVDGSEFVETDVVTDVYSGGSWAGEKTNGLIQGDIGGDNIEAIKARIKNAPVPGGIKYNSYMQSYEWQEESGDGQVSGMPDGNKRLEAITMELTGELSSQYDIYYRVYVKDWGWMDWAQNGEPAGSSGYGKSILALDTRLVQKGEAAPGDREQPYKTTDRMVAYNTHVQSYGWQAEVGDGDISGTVGEAKRLEAIKISVHVPNVSGDVQYSTHVQSYGWQNWVKNGQESGTSGEAKRLEAIKIKLTGELAEKYDIYYRVHAQSYGWLGWAKSGEEAGTEGMAKRLEAIQIRLVKKGSSAPGNTSGHFITPKVTYNTHVQSYGWQSTVYDGGISGTEGAAKRLEAIKIQLYNPETSGDIQYSTHVQSYGWQGWVKNGQISGTSGQAKRLEAIKIKLTGKMAEKYDVYYRVHAQSYGWLGWAKNGEEAGTEGMAKRLEAIQVELVEKGGKAPGTTSGHFHSAQVAYKTHVQSYGWQSDVFNGATSGTVGKAKRLEAITIRNAVSGVQGNILYRTHVQTYGWESSWKKNGQISGTSGQAKRLEAICIKLDGELAEKYDVYYRVHVESHGWLGWAKNGEPAGTEGMAKRLEGIQIQYVEKGGKAPGSTDRPYLK